MQQTSRVYRVLREVAVVETDTYYPTVIAIAKRIQMNDAIVRTIARTISHPSWDWWAPTDQAEMRGHPWLRYFRHQDTMSVTTDGHDALNNARSKPHLTTDISRWKDEAITGITASGEPTEIINPVLSSQGIRRGGVRDPEGQTQRDLLVRRYGVLPEWIKRTEQRDVLWCSCCHRQGRWPLHPPGDFRKIKSGRRHECKTCEKEARDRRRVG